MLAFRQADHQAFEGVGDLDLAGEARIVLHRLGEVEHRLLHRRAGAGLVEPGLVHIDVAGGAGAGAAAFSLDPGNIVADRGFHHG